MSDARFMRLALRLARRGFGATTPNPMVGAVLVKGGKIIGRGWHRRAGLPHAEVEALHDARKRGHNAKGATLFVTLEPCSTHGRTPPCTDAIIAARIKRVVVGATDPNPRHAGKGFKVLRRAGIEVDQGILSEDCTHLNEAFNHWIIHRTPVVTVKAAMTLDGKIATARGESKWITGKKARNYGMKLREGSDAILVGINTILADNPSLTFRRRNGNSRRVAVKTLRRIVLDSMARTPLDANVVSDGDRASTTIVVTRFAPKQRVMELAKRARVLIAPTAKRSACKSVSRRIELRWLLKKLGQEDVTSLLVEGGGEVNAQFLLGGQTQRIAFFFAPRILGGRDSHKAVAGNGVPRLEDAVRLEDVTWKRIGADLLLTARVASKS